MSGEGSWGYTNWRIHTGTDRRLALLSFRDDQGIERVAEIPYAMFEELMIRSLLFESRLRGGNHYQDTRYIYATDSDNLLTRIEKNRPSTTPRDTPPGYHKGPYQGPPFPGSRQEPYFEQIFRDLSEAWGNIKYPTNHNQPKNAMYNRLCEFARLSTPYPKESPDGRARILRKAKARCHPDTGGSVEQWRELERLAKSMGLKW